MVTMTLLKFLRLKNNWSQEKLSNMIGLPRHETSVLERGLLRDVPERWKGNLRRCFPDYTFEQLMEEKE